MRKRATDCGSSLFNPTIALEYFSTMSGCADNFSRQLPGSELIVIAVAVAIAVAVTLA